VLDGVDEFVEINPDNEELFDFTDGEGFSISAWFQVAAFEKSWQALVAKGEGNRWRVHRRGGESVLTGNGGNADVSPGSTAVNDDAWHHMVLVSTPDEGVVLYVDCEIEGESGPPNLENNDMPMMIGENPDARNRTWNGCIDDLAVWNRPLTEEEVAELWDSKTALASILGGVPDADRDGMSDKYETENGLDPNDPADRDLDKDGDGLTNIQEFNGTDIRPRTLAGKADSDEDSLNDNVETNTGIYVSATDTGTNPLKPDTDKDGLNDNVESNTRVFVSATDTNPNIKDTDGDGVGDGPEVAAGTDPIDKNSVPSCVKGGGVFTTTHVWTEGDPQISDVATAEEVTLDPGDAENITVEHAFIHYHDNATAPIFQELSEPYPLWGPQGNDEGPGDRNDFAIRSVGNINVTCAGLLTFVCNSDDGFDLRIDGESIGEAGNRGRGNTFMEVELTAGIHEVEFIHWERGGGAGVSVYVFRSVGDAGASLNDSEWQLLEASGGGDGPPFQITNIEKGPDSVTITWPSREGESFIVEQSVSETAFIWEEITDGHPSGGDETSIEVEIPDPAPEALFLRVSREE
jgi:hypothetical protein